MLIYGSVWRQATKNVRFSDAGWKWFHGLRGWIGEGISPLLGGAEFFDGVGGRRADARGVFCGAGFSGRVEFALVRHVKWVFALVLVLLAATAGAQEESVVPIEQAGAHDGQTAAVRGVVTNVSRPANGNVHLNFGGAFPNQLFSVFIRGSDAGAFTNLDTLAGQEVTVTGRIELHKGKPQIVVTAPGQLVVGGAAAPVPAAAPATPSVQAPAVPAVTAPAAPAGSGVLAGLRPGSVLTFRVPLSPEAQKFARAEGNPGAGEATVGVCVPPGFAPGKAWPVLVVFTTSDGDFSHVKRMTAFVRTAAAKGWVVLAGDGPAKPPKIAPEWCWAMLSTGLDALEKEWPGVKTWSFACAGNSGGAKMSGLMAPLMAENGLKISGVFMGGCNADLLSVGIKEYRPPAGFKKVAVYLSSGDTDRTATPAQVANVAASMKATGFRNLKLQTYAGGHGMDDAQLGEALDWFAAGGMAP